MDNKGIVQAAAQRLPLRDGCADLIITDPPYAVMKYTFLPRRHAKPITRYLEWDNMTESQWYRLMRQSAREMFRICRPGATVYCFCAGELITLLRAALVRAGFTWRTIHVWHKLNPAPRIYLTGPQSSVEVFGMVTKGKGQTFNAENGGLCHNHFEFPSPTGNDRVHQTQKPLDLMLELVARSSNPGDLVVDPFMGSGVTGQAAIMTGRRFFGCDTNFYYVRDMASFKVYHRASPKAVENLPLFKGI